MDIPSGNDCYIANWKITMLLMGKLTISMGIFHSYVKLPDGKQKWSHFGTNSLPRCDLDPTQFFPQFGEGSVRDSKARVLLSAVLLLDGFMGCEQIQEVQSVDQLSLGKQQNHLPVCGR